jgi:N-acetylglutamate synthase-like GNAT family acetyltransferase
MCSWWHVTVGAAPGERIHSPIVDRMLPLTPVTPADVADLTDFLRLADLTLSGLDSAAVRLWLTRDADSGRVVASTGYERSEDNRHVLIRSVAVDHERRGLGWGLQLARFALDHAAASGADHAWLFSRRSGPFWQQLGFVPADRDELARVLASTYQVRLFTETGQLPREVAWGRSLRTSAPTAAEGKPVAGWRSGRMLGTG